MTALSPTAQAAALSLLQAQVVLLDENGTVRENFGQSLVPIEPGQTADEAFPFAVGLIGEDTLEIGPLTLVGDEHEAVPPFHFYARPQAEGGHVIALRDSSAEWALDQRLMQSRNELSILNRQLSRAVVEAQASSESKSEFLSSITHDLRTPLSIIIGNGELLAGEPSLATDPVRGDMISDINEQAGNLMGLIDELLDTAAAETGQMSAQDETVDLSELVEQVVRTFRGHALAAGLQLCIEVGTLPAMSLDPRRMIQVMNNLIINAINYTPRGGTILIRGDSRADGGVNLAVIDSGMGIAPAELKNLGDPFYTTSNRPVVSGAKSSGLGLHNVKKILNLYGAHLKVESELGFGTSFWVLLPGHLSVAN